MTYRHDRAVRWGLLTGLAGGDSVTALENLDLWIEQSHVVWDEFVKGNPEPAKNLYSHRDDIALANPFGSIAVNNGRRRLGACLVTLMLLSSVACSKGESVMPDVHGMREDAASDALGDAGIEDWTVRFIEGSKPMVVKDQDPEPGEIVDSETEILITLDGR
jgi:PASTA domain